jgi:hypothetical protein
MEIRVACSRDPHGEEIPSQLSFDNRTLGVSDVLDRWLAPDHRYFKVKGEDGATYILRHDVVSNTWALVLYARQGMR